MANRAFTDIIDDENVGGGGDGLTWATAWEDLDDYITNGSPAAGDIVAIGHNTLDKFVYIAAKVYSSTVSTGVPIALISCTQGTGAVSGGGFTFAQATSDQLNSTVGAYSIKFNDSWELHGIQVNSGDDILFDCNNDGVILSHNSVYKPGQSDFLNFISGGGKIISINDTIDLVNWASGSATRVISAALATDVHGLTITGANASNATGELVVASQGAVFTGIDFSACTASTMDLIDSSNVAATVRFNNCKAPATWTPFGAVSFRGGRIIVASTEDVNQPERLMIKDDYGELWSTTAMVRTGGATSDLGTAFSWGGPTAGIETTSECSRGKPFYTEWFGATITSTGAKTLTVYLQSDIQLNTDTAWLEAEAKTVSSTGLWTVTDTKASPVIVTVELTSDTSTWTTNKTKRYKLELAVTVNTVGRFRVRVGFGATSMIAADDTFVDPAVFVS